VARNIRALAARRRIGVSVLADLAGVSRTQMFAVLGCTKATTVDWLEKVAHALGVEPWRLLAEGESGQGEPKKAQPRRATRARES
jgi:hypothetical protein